jgi:sulfur-carrier protein
VLNPEPLYLHPMYCFAVQQEKKVGKSRRVREKPGAAPLWFRFTKNPASEEAGQSKGAGFRKEHAVVAVVRKGRNDSMAVKVLIPTPLRQFTGKQSSIECNAATVGEALGSLTGTFSDLKKHLFTDEGKIRSFVNVYLNDEDIRFLEKENTRTKDGDTISIVPSIAGGSARSATDPRCNSERNGESLFGFFW